MAEPAGERGKIVGEVSAIGIEQGQLDRAASRVNDPALGISKREIVDSFEQVWAGAGLEMGKLGGEGVGDFVEDGIDGFAGDILAGEPLTEANGAVGKQGSGNNGVGGVAVGGGVGEGAAEGQPQMKQFELE